MAEQAVRQVFQGFEEAVQVHLVVVASSHYIFVDDVVVGFHYVAVRQPGVFGQLLKLVARDEVVALLASQDFEHLFGV